MINLSVFVERVKEYMDESNLSVTALAESIKFSRTTVSNLINGAHAPSTEIIIALADYFNCSTDYLLGRIDYPADKQFFKAQPIGERLRKCLKESGESEYRLQKELKLSSSLTYRWLNDKAMPNVKSLLKISEHYGCSVDYLLGREN